MITIYKASAGSGKTNTISKSFILLAFENYNKFSAILAVTFTNKAAGEMKERIIEEFDTLANKTNESKFLKDITEKYNFSEVEISNTAKIILKKILHNYTFLSISTIDSFVQKVIRSFTFELNLPSTYKLELDTQKVIADISDVLLSKVNENKELQNWLKDYAFDRISNSKSWDFRESIIEFSKIIFQESFHKFFSDKKTDYKNFQQIVYKTIKNFENRTNEFVEQANIIISQSGIANEKLSSKITYLCNFFLNYHKNKLITFNNTLQTAIDENDWWNKTTKQLVKNQWENTVQKLKSFIDEIIFFEQKEGINYYTAIQIRKNLFTFGLIKNLKDILPTYREENNVLLISDLTVLLKNILGNNEAPFIYEKIGNRYENIMIDEFQDTSEYQWSNFKPLIENTLSQNRQNLIVGDVKQSIYRWRNGDWRLLHSGVKNEIGKMYVSETSLDTNWRSKRDVVLFNNSLFNKLPEILKTKLLSDNTNSDEFIEMSNVLISAYEDTIQKIAKKNQEGGYVELNFYDNKNSFNEGIEESIINTIKNLFEKNFKAGDIAFLTRTNAESVKIMEILLAYNAEIEEDKQFNVISAESLLLSNSLTIKILISCLKLISNPTEIIYLYEIISNYYQLTNQKITKEIFEIETFKEAEKFLPLDFINLFEIFSNYSLFELVEKLLSYFELTKNKNEIAFIRTFQETINNYVSDTGKDLNGFLKYWDKKQNNISVQLSEQNEAMQVMTIHKSKGLAFKIVIMPFITWDITPNNDTILWGNTSSTIFNHYAYFPIYYNKDLPKTHFASEFFSEKLYACMDALNMLYVAFTRAQEQIIGFSYLTQTRNGNNIGDHLCRAIIESEEENTDKYLIPLKKYYDETLLRFCIGEQIYFEQKINEQYKSFEIRNYPTHDWYDNVSIVTHSEDLIADTLKNRKLAIKHGIQMHMLFSKIKTYDDVENVLNELKQNNKINEKDKNEIFDTINKVFENEQVKYWFDKSWILHNEKEILTKYGETKIPDRVISNQNEVIVIDYKFGLEQGEHKRQISRYLTLIKEIETVKKYTGYLLYADTMKIVEITN